MSIPSSSAGVEATPSSRPVRRAAQRAASSSSARLRKAGTAETGTAVSVTTAGPARRAQSGQSSRMRQKAARCSSFSARISASLVRLS